MPRDVPSRLICQSSAAASSPPRHAVRGIQKTGVPRSLWVAMWSKTCRVSPATVATSKWSARRDVHVVRLGFAGDEGTEEDEGREGAGANGEPMDALKALRDDAPLLAAAAKMCRHRRERAAMQARRQVAARIEIGKRAHAAQAASEACRCQFPARPELRRSCPGRSAVCLWAAFRWLSRSAH